jgi:hypothetical protein
MVDFIKKLAEERAAEKAAALDAKIKSASTPDSPSLRPEKRKKPKKDEEVVPELTSLSSVPSIERLKMIRLMGQHIQLSAQISGLESQKDAVADQLKDLCNRYSTGKFKHQDIKVSPYITRRSTIVKELLMSQNVPLATIVAATKTTQTPSIRITPPGKKEEDYENSTDAQIA